MDRRNFIKMLGLASTSAAAYAACSAYMHEALAQSTAIDDLLTAAAHCAGGSLKDIDHVIFLMQENRSFDHYYGTLRGVRGFGDPRPLQLKNGDPVFSQPKAPGLQFVSYSLNNLSWDVLETLVASKDTATIKANLKGLITQFFPDQAALLTPHIDTMPDGFVLHVVKGEWDEVLPKEMVGKTIPELLQELKEGLLKIKPTDIDPSFGALVKDTLLSLLDNAVFMDFIAKTVPGGSSLSPAMVKTLLSSMSGQMLIGMVLPMLASAINVEAVKTAWPAAEKVLPSLKTGLPKPAEIFVLLQNVSRQFAGSPLVGMLPDDLGVIAPFLPADISKFITDDVKKAYPKLVAWIKGTGRVKPFQVRRDTGSAGEYKSFGLPHTYDDARDAINRGWNDKWLLTKGEAAMAHLDVAKDIPYYHKLASAFTLCDGYHCSTHTGTEPNRSHFWSGTAGGLTDNSFFSGLQGPRPDWQTYPERLQELGISWKCYQNGLDGDMFFGNFDDTTLQFFKQYQTPGTEIAERALSTNTVLRTKPDVASQLEQDIAAAKLPAVSWITAPQAFSEHPGGISPHFGEYYVNEILKVLAAYPEVWKKTVFIINYDENDGFFDHVPPPLPPLPAAKDVGKASEGIVISAGIDPKDFNTEHATSLKQDLSKPEFARFPVEPRPELTMGLGNRVPCLIISPWTVGGRICSETFDHTSALRFLDAWLAAKGLQPEGTTFGNISSWRRAICGDLTSALDFARLPDDVAKAGKDKLDAAVGAAKAVPAYLTETQQAALIKSLPKYEGQGTDIATDLTRETRLKQDRTQVSLLPLGYDFNVFASLTEGKALNLEFRNRGRIGVALNLYSYHATDKDRGAWFYALAKTADPAKAVTVADAFDLDMRSGSYDFVVYGPNGYLSAFKGETNEGSQLLIADIVDVQALTDGSEVRFAFGKWPSANGDLRVVNAYTGATLDVAAGSPSVTLATRDGWYDVSFVDKAGTGYLRRYAGHIENGKISRTDPAIGLEYDEEKRIYLGMTA